jgi:hypothetical protein
VHVTGPGYLSVGTVAEIVPLDIDQAEAVKQRANAALAMFLHPLAGGPLGAGWPFGRNVYESEISQVLEGVSGVSFVKAFRFQPNVAQHWLTLLQPIVAAREFPENSAVVVGEDHQIAALLAETVALGTQVVRLATKGFKEGDRLAPALDLRVTRATSSAAQLDLDVVSLGGPIDGTMLRLPRGSSVLTADGAQRSHLTRGIQQTASRPVSTLSIEPTFSTAEPGDIVTVVSPFPLTVTSVVVEGATSGTRTQRLGIEPFDLQDGLGAGTLLVRLDNRVRSPLAISVPGGQIVTAVSVQDLAAGVAVRVVPEADLELPSLQGTIESVVVADDVVYVDENFLVYPGQHHITLVGR